MVNKTKEEDKEEDYELITLSNFAYGILGVILLTIVYLGIHEIVSLIFLEFQNHNELISTIIYWAMAITISTTIGVTVLFVVSFIGGILKFLTGIENKK